MLDSVYSCVQQTRVCDGSAASRCSESSISTRRLGYFVRSVAAQLQDFVRGPNLAFGETTASLLANDRLLPQNDQLVDSAYAAQALHQACQELAMVDNDERGEVGQEFERVAPPPKLPAEAVIIIDGADELVGTGSRAGAQLLSFIWSFPWPSWVRVVVTAQPSLQLPAPEESGTNSWTRFDFDGYVNRSFAKRSERKRHNQQKAVMDEMTWVASQIVRNAFAAGRETLQ